MTDWHSALLIIGMAIATYLTRYPLLAISGRRTLPSYISQALSYAPVTVLSAICAPIIFSPEGHLDISVHNPWLIGAAATTITSIVSRHLILTISVGLFVFFLMRYLLA